MQIQSFTTEALLNTYKSQTTHIFGSTDTTMSLLLTVNFLADALRSLIVKSSPSTPVTIDSISLLKAHILMTPISGFDDHLYRGFARDVTNCIFPEVGHLGGQLSHASVVRVHTQWLLLAVLWAAVTVVDGTKGFLSTIYLQFYRFRERRHLSYLPSGAKNGLHA